MSDSYDPEFGTGSNVNQIDEALARVYTRVSEILGNRPPRYILDLVALDLPTAIPATLTEKDWRLIRFALERAKESL